MSKTKSYYAIIFAGILTSSFGFINNFPFLYPDSSAYLHSGIDLGVPNSRPVFYGLFLRALHMKDNLYFCIIGQSLLLAYVLSLPFKYSDYRQHTWQIYLITITVLILGTSYSFYASFLTPDFFGAILFLTMWLLLFRDLSRRDYIICFVLLVYAILVHNAHLIIFTLCVTCSLFIRNGEQYSIRRRVNNLYLGATVLIAVMATSFLVNRALGAKEILPRNGHHFIISRFNETGLLSEYLSNNCSDNKYSLCAYKDSLTADYLWDQSSPMYKLGGWDADSKQYQVLLSDMFHSPKFLKRFIVLSFYSTFIQFFSWEIEPQNPQKLSYITEVFQVHEHDMSISMQNRGNRVDFRLLNSVQFVIIISSLVFSFLIINFMQSLPIEVKAAFIFLFVFLIWNACIFGTLSTVLTRYQGRVIYLIPYFILLFGKSIFGNTKFMGKLKSII